MKREDLEKLGFEVEPPEEGKATVIFLGTKRALAMKKALGREEVDEEKEPGEK